ncbi:hypothetical protein ABZW11_22430 [Nonomuraea sp. NPDC004580]|uniref:hypothetical protein n=1 Tax=Nonomuraea sp. NPDC004580 TaxID=3154552 RepID=UPI0033A916DC
MMPSWKDVAPTAPRTYRWANWGDNGGDLETVFSKDDHLVTLTAQDTAATSPRGRSLMSGYDLRRTFQGTPMRPACDDQLKDDGGRR